MIIDIGTKQILEVEFDNCDLIKNLIQTCFEFPDDYPPIEFEVAGKPFQTWFVGYKATGNRVFMLKNGTCITEEKKRIKDLSKIIWRLRLERD